MVNHPGAAALKQAVREEISMVEALEIYDQYYDDKDLEMRNQLIAMKLGACLSLAEQICKIIGAGTGGWDDWVPIMVVE